MSEAIAPNRPDVIDEIFDGEAVLVNLRTGRYFSLNSDATAVWELIVSGAEPASLLASLAAARDADPAELAPAIDWLLTELAGESLIAGGAPAGPGVQPAAGDRFAPAVQVFRDMEDLLLLDPIHDVDLDGAGWPSLSAAE
jgi:hypothetical protein